MITGLGIVSSIGIGVRDFWEAALAGRSGISALPALSPFGASDFRSRVAGSVRDFDPSTSLATDPWERIDRFAQFALVAAREAVADARLEMSREPSDRIGVIAGAGMGGMIIGEREFTRLYESARPHFVHPNLIPAITLNAASGIVAIALGAKGPNLTISTACSSSAHAIGQGLICIRTGQADVVVVVGADASVTPLTFAGFCALRVLSTGYNDAPARASRPFDRGRDGFVVGEGAGAIVLESLRHARRRRATVYAEVVGYAATSEAHHMVVPREDGVDVARTIRLALRDARLDADEVDYVNAHATSTVLGDVAESRALRQVFGARTDELAVAATKSLVGHTLGAAGAIGAVVTALTLREGQVHPTANYDDPDPACALGGVSRQAQERSLRVGVVNAMGFGSNNAALVLRRGASIREASR